MTKPISNKRRINIIKAFARDVEGRKIVINNHRGGHIGTCDEDGVFMALFADNTSKVMFNRYLAVKDKMNLFERRRYLELRQYHRRSR